jgi:hypothetical protein
MAIEKNNSEITSSVAEFLRMYPESTLEDIYKGFFQDEFGPGHLLSDVEASRKYLLRELSLIQSKKRYKAEPCGTGQNFYRVNLDLILDGYITVDDYFKAFEESATSFRLPDIEDWKEKWAQTEILIRPLQNQIKGYKKSILFLNKRLSDGKAVAHHSKAFVEKYDPHYRIIHRSLIEKYFKEIVNI